MAFNSFMSANDNTIDAHNTNSFGNAVTEIFVVSDECDPFICFQLIFELLRAFVVCFC
ncbi:hypothetical protein C5167_005106 [Papaver somniferum]|uniref:Uncharacterized protein n=1 Tax=Papaver somniferum TaxID=3469 RepID=A0A4Y7J9J0_PAPSO|nr:hypothetical protein C5167_005106 [Papaver somniferum]